VALTDKERRFCEEYPIDWNGTQAAIRAGYSVKTAYKIASENLQKPHIKAEIDKVRIKLRQNAEVSAGLIIDELRDHIVADPREMVEVRRNCCRFCYGIGHQYQETPAQRRARETERYQLQLTMTDKEWRNMPPFDEMGGIGFNPKRPPVEDCPECFGDGEEQVIVKDTRYLSPAAAKLYRGVKVTKDGVEVKMTDPKFALDKLGQNLGLWKDQNDDPSGGQVTVQVVQISPEQAKALPPPDPQDYET
jgi:phage terminase small subunit